MKLKTLGALELLDTKFKRRDPLLLLAYVTTEGQQERADLTDLFFPKYSVLNPSDSLTTALRLLEKNTNKLFSRQETFVISNVACDYLDLKAAFEKKNYEECIDLYEGVFLAGIDVKRKARKTDDNEVLSEFETGLEEWLRDKRFEVTNWILEACLQLSKPLMSSDNTGLLEKYAELAYEVFAERYEEDDFRSGESRFSLESLKLLHGLLEFIQSDVLSEFKERIFVYDDLVDFEDASTDLSEFVKHNLGSLNSDFLGREQDILEITRFLSDTQRLVSLVGVGGVGKTQLLLQVGFEQLKLGNFNDGIYFVKLDDLKIASLIPNRIAKILELDLAPVPDAVDQVSEFIGNQKMLLLLDNFEHLVERADLLELLLTECPYLRILVSSREVLSLSAEYVFSVEGLPVPDSSVSFEVAEQFACVQLFMQSAQRVSAEFILDEDVYGLVRDLCDVLQGIPLVIDLAARLVDMIPVGELTEYLAKDIDLLASNSSSLPLRQRSVRSVWEYSWNLLSEDEQITLALLAIFPNDFDWKAAKYIANVSLTTLNRFAKKSLLNVEEYRFSFHLLLRQFTLDFLPKLISNIDEVTKLYVNYYLDLCELNNNLLNGADARKALMFFDAEIINIDQAWSYCEDEVTLMRFVDSLETYQDRRRLFSERLVLLEYSLSKVESSSEHLSQIHNELAETFQNKGDLFVAEMHLKKSLSYQQQNESSYIKADTLNELGGVYYHRREFDKASMYLREALLIYQDLEDVVEESNTLNNIAALEYQMGNIDQGIELWKDALKIQRRVRDLSQQALILHNLGGAYRGIGELEEALIYLEKAKELRENLGDEVGLIFTLNNLGAVAFQKGDFVESKRTNEQILAWQREKEDLHGQALTLNNLAMIFERWGELEASQELLLEALRLQEYLDDVQNRAMTLYNLSTVVLQQGNIERALVLAKQSLTMANETENLIAKGYALLFLAEAYFKNEQIDEAVMTYQKAIDLHEEVDPFGLVMSQNSFSKALLEMGRLHEANDLALKAFEGSEKLGSGTDKRNSQWVLGKIAFMNGNNNKSKYYFSEVIKLNAKLQHPLEAEDEVFFNSLLP